MQNFLEVHLKLEEIGYDTEIEQKEDAKMILKVFKNKKIFIKVIVSSRVGNINANFLFSFHYENLFGGNEKEEKEKKILENIILKALEDTAKEKEVASITVQTNLVNPIFVIEKGYLSLYKTNFEKKYPYLTELSGVLHVKVLNEEKMKNTSKKIKEFKEFLEAFKEKEVTFEFNRHGQTHYSFYYEGVYGTMEIKEEEKELVLKMDNITLSLRNPKQAGECLIKKIEEKTRIRNLQNPPSHYLRIYTDFSERNVEQLQQNLLKVYPSYKKIEEAFARKVKNKERYFEKRVPENKEYLVAKVLDYYIILKEKNKEAEDIFDIIYFGTKEDIKKELERLLVGKAKKDIDEVLLKL